MEVNEKLCGLLLSSTEVLRSFIFFALLAFSDNFPISSFGNVGKKIYQCCQSHGSQASHGACFLLLFESSFDFSFAQMKPARCFSTVEEEYKVELEQLYKDYEKRMETKQALIGVVTSTKCAKSITITIKKDKYIPKYNKYLCRTKKKMVHDEEERAKLGDLVRVVPCPPKSKKKRHMLFEIIKRHPANLPGAPQLHIVAAEGSRKAKTTDDRMQKPEEVN